MAMGRAATSSCLQLAGQTSKGARVVTRAVPQKQQPRPSDAITRPAEAIVIAGPPIVKPELKSSLSFITDSAAMQWYFQKLEQSPMLTKQWTSFVGFGIGDTIAQLVTEGSLDPTRTAILALYGWLVDAPCGNAFYQWLDANVEPSRPKSGIAVAKKIALDQLLYAPVFTVGLYVYLALANGDFNSIPDIVQAKVVPTLLANWAMWPLAHYINFKYVPTDGRILYNNCIAVAWTTWLSYMAHG